MLAGVQQEFLTPIIAGLLRSECDDSAQRVSAKIDERLLF